VPVLAGAIQQALAVEWPAVSAIVGVIGLSGAVIAYLNYRRGRVGVQVKGYMEHSGEAIGKVINTGGVEIQIARLDMVLRHAAVFRLRHPLMARKGAVYPVSAAAGAFSGSLLKPHSQIERTFRFDDRREFELPSRRLTGPALYQRAPARSELRMWAEVPGRHAVYGPIQQLRKGQRVQPSREPG
jgi:hypothetical protein